MSAILPRAPGFGARIVLALLLVAAADLLLFAGAIGFSLALFAACLGLASIATNGTGARRAALAGALVLAAVAPLAENFSALSLMVSFAVLAAAVLVRRGPPGAVFVRLPRFLAAAPLRFLADCRTARRAARRRPARGCAGLVRLGGWVVPAGLASVFVALFGMANPLIGEWLALIDPVAWLTRIGIAEMVFWLLVFLLVWPFLRPRLRRRSSRRAAAAPRPAALSASAADLLFGPAAILRSLAVFNLVFACQTILDGAYLWGGVALPDGMTYAAYAHRGAYPLVAAALVAAGFVLVALRPGSAASRDRAIRWLVYLWTAQTVALVASSMLRLDLYVDTYSLTYWRAAAFAWMALVAAGLLAIVARIVLGRSNRWLLGVNLALAAVTLYAACFVDFAALIADYNVAHSVEMDGNGAALDVDYLVSLGPAAVPALDALLRHRPDPQTAGGVRLPDERAALAVRHRAAMADWRARTFRGMRLSRYLVATEGEPVVAPAPDVAQPGRAGE